MPQVLRYHVIACHQLLLENLKLTPNATSLQGEPVVISVSQQNLTTAAMNHGYIKFSNLIQDSGLLSVITDPIHTPVTLFWPTDQALQALPAEQQDFLFSQDNKDKLKEYIKFHVIRDAKVLAVDLPRSAAWKTLQGSELSVQCGTDSDIGKLFLNDQPCRIIQREILFDLGVAYGIDCLLIDPTLGGRCDTFTTFNVSVSPRKHSSSCGKRTLRQRTALMTRHGLCCETTEGWSSESGTQEIRGRMTVFFRFTINKHLPAPAQALQIFIYPPTRPSIYSLTIKETVVGHQPCALPVIFKPTHPSSCSFIHSKAFLSFCSIKP
uniref:Stabilin 2 n=1 Tax=Molossus molossus TaxID=27622 RepID=A0A7J8G1N6_MOLMO|nr:stabilin 2 [Molossus molossus]